VEDGWSLRKTPKKTTSIQSRFFVDLPLVTSVTTSRSLAHAIAGIEARRTDAAETVDGNLDLGLGDRVDGGSLLRRWKRGQRVFVNAASGAERASTERDGFC
jgi:hypothetical protein